jgi:hypothetical protein
MSEGQGNLRGQNDAVVLTWPAVESTSDPVLGKSFVFGAVDPCWAGSLCGKEVIGLNEVKVPLDFPRANSPALRTTRKNPSFLN